MNRIFLLLCTLLLIVTGVTGQKSKPSASDPNTWRRYTIKGEEFSVALPSMPGMTTTKEQERLGRHFRTRLDGVQYGLDVFENPNAQSLDVFVSEYQSNSKDALPQGRNVIINGVAGKEFSTTNSPKATVQFFATERRLYRVIALGANTENPVVQQFFSSIRLGKKADDAVKVSEGPGMPLELETGERIYKGEELDRRPRLLSKPEPVIPEEARRRGASVTVVLQAIFSSTGKVVDLKVINPGYYGLTEASIAAAEKITFIPGMKDGKNVSMYMTLEYNFYL